MSKENDMPDSSPADLPVARVELPAISRLWIKWLPLSIMFFGLAFASWTIVQVVTTIHRSEETSALERRVETLEAELAKAKAGQAVEYWVLERRVETLEAELAKAKAGQAVEYWVRQCEHMFLRGDFKGLEKPVESP